MVLATPELSAQIMRDKLLSAYGGAKTLQSINTFSANLRIARQQGDATERFTRYDFDFNSIYQSFPDGREVIVKNGQAIERSKNGRRDLSSQEIQDLIEGMQLNFFYHLRHPKLVLEGPITVRDYPELSWWRLHSGEVVSPPLGLDPTSGRIHKVLFSDTAIVHESDYQTLTDGVNWPHRFELFRQGQPVLVGEFSQVSVSP